MVSNKKWAELRICFVFFSLNQIFRTFAAVFKNLIFNNNWQSGVSRTYTNQAPAERPSEWKSWQDNALMVQMVHGTNGTFTILKWWWKNLTPYSSCEIQHDLLLIVSSPHRPIAFFSGDFVGIWWFFRINVRFVL